MRLRSFSTCLVVIAFSLVGSLQPFANALRVPGAREGFIAGGGEAKDIARKVADSNGGEFASVAFAIREGAAAPPQKVEGNVLLDPDDAKMEKLVFVPGPRDEGGREQQTLGCMYAGHELGAFCMQYA